MTTPKLISIITLNTLIGLVAISCSTNQLIEHETNNLQSDNKPDTKKEFESFKKKCMQTKVSSFNTKIRHANFNDTLLAEEVDSKFRYTYLIWIYTGYYDSETIIHPYYVYPQTPKGKVMHDGLLKGLKVALSGK